MIWYMVCLKKISWCTIESENVTPSIYVIATAEIILKASPNCSL